MQISIDFQKDSYLYSCSQLCGCALEGIVFVNSSRKAPPLCYTPLRQEYSPHPYMPAIALDPWNNYVDNIGLKVVLEVSRYLFYPKAKLCDGFKRTLVEALSIWLEITIQSELKTQLTRTPKKWISWDDLSYILLISLGYYYYYWRWNFINY